MVSWEELWEVFQALVQQGKIDYVGSSNFAGWDLIKAQAAAKERHFLGLVSEQHKYSLLCRLPELEVLPAAKDQGIGVIVWSPLDGGLLGGNALNPAAGSRSANQMERVEKHRQQLEAFSGFCKEFGEKEADVALAWVLQHPAVDAPIIGPRTLEQFEQALRAVEIEFDQQALDRLNDIFPGYGEAPYHYAW